MKKKSRFLTFILSFMPGAGHMYQGYLRQGVELMILFFLCFYLSDWLRTSIFIIIAPVIWFFSFFDSLNKEDVEETNDEDIKIFNWLKGNESWLTNRAKIVGWALVILGGYLLFDRLILPQLGTVVAHIVREYSRIVIISGLLIGVGIKLITGNKAIIDSKIEGEKNEKI